MPQNWKIFPKRPGDLVEYGGEKIFFQKTLDKRTILCYNIYIR